MACLISSLNYASRFAMTRLLFMKGGTENTSVYSRGCGFVNTQFSKRLNETGSILLCKINMNFVSELNQGESNIGRTSV